MKHSTMSISNESRASGGTLMNKASESIALLQYLFSAKRRRKFQLLLSEWVKGTFSSERNTAPIVENGCADPIGSTWKSEETLKVDSQFFNNATVDLVERHTVENGEVTVEFEHSVHTLKNAYAYTNESTHFSIFNQASHRVIPLSTHKSYGSFRPPSRRRLPSTRTIPGVTANLYGPIDCAEGNYFHWFVDGLARLFLIERTCPLESIDQVLVPPLKYDFQWDALAAFGFDKSRILELPALECYQFETLLVSSAPRGKGSPVFPGWGIDRYRDVLMKHAENTPSVCGKKIYVSRRDAPRRIFENEDEVCEFFEKQGFDIVELTPLNLAQKIAVFRDAEVIVSPTGAGLTNLMFCKEGFKLLELVSEDIVYPSFSLITDYVGGHHYPHYYTNTKALARVNSFVGNSSLSIESLSRSLEKLA